MSFAQKTHKRKRSAKSEQAAEVPMTPMIDVVFQLLVYFIVTFEPNDLKFSSSICFKCKCRTSEQVRESGRTFD